MRQPGGVIRHLIQDLQPYPGRANQVMRTVLACAIVVIISQTLQIQWLGLSLIAVFFVTQTNVVVTRLTGILFIVAVTLSLALSLLILTVTWNVPLLRILAASAIFLGSVFLMRATPYGAVFFVVALIVIYSQSLVDISSDAEFVIRNILWVWVAVSYAIVVTLIVNTFLLPVEPVKQLKQAMLAQLDIIVDLLDPEASELRSRVDVLNAGHDMQSLYKLLRYCVMRDNSYRDQESQHLARVSTIAELHTLASHLPPIIDNPADVAAAHNIRQACLDMKAAIQRDVFAQQTNIPEAATSNAVLKSMIGTLNTYYHGTPSSPSASGPKKKRFFVSDAFSNPRYRAFALKTLLSVLISYLLYTGTDWSGIHTMMLSCLIVAQPGLGNTQRKMILRLSGAALGSLIALFSIVFILPHLDSIFGLLLLVIPVVAIGAWGASGPESISYGGIQVMFTFSLAVLETFAPSFELTEVRDRIVGIFAGIVIAGIIHTIISPEREGEILLSRLARLVEQARQVLTGGMQQPYGRSAIITEMAECEAVASRVALEPTWSTEGAQDLVYQRLQGMLHRVKSIVMYANQLSLVIEHLPEPKFHQSEHVIQMCQQRLAETRDWLLGKKDIMPVSDDLIALRDGLPEELQTPVAELFGAIYHLYQLSDDE